MAKSDLHSRPVTFRLMFNSEAFRQGFEDVRTNAPPKFGTWGIWDVPYETGRLVAANARASGQSLPSLGTKGRIPAHTFRWLKEQHWNYRFDLTAQALGLANSASPHPLSGQVRHG